MRCPLPLLASVASLLACGSPAGPSIPAAFRADQPTSIDLQSDSGDYIGQGQAYHYTDALAAIQVNAGSGSVNISVAGNELWGGSFAVPGGGRFRRGTWTGLTRYPFNGSDGGLSWFGQQRGCKALTGRFTVENVVFRQDSLRFLALTFEQHCEGAAAALRGTVVWNGQ